MRASGGFCLPLTVHPWEEEQGHPLLEIPQSLRDMATTHLMGNKSLPRSPGEPGRAWPGGGRV